MAKVKKFIDDKILLCQNLANKKIITTKNCFLFSTLADKKFGVKN